MQESKSWGRRFKTKRNYDLRTCGSRYECLDLWWIEIFGGNQHIQFLWFNNLGVLVLIQNWESGFLRMTILSPPVHKLQNPKISLYVFYIWIVEWTISGQNCCHCWRPLFSSLFYSLVNQHVLSSMKFSCMWLCSELRAFIFNWNCYASIYAVVRFLNFEIGLFIGVEMFGWCPWIL